MLPTPQSNKLAEISDNFNTRLKEVLDRAALSNMTMLDVFDASIRNYFETKILKEQIFTFIAANITELQSLYNVVRPMTGEQIEQIADIIIEEQQNFSLRDFAMFFKTLKAGSVNGGKGEHEYKQPFDRIDLGLINEWLRVYKQARIDAKQIKDAKEAEAVPVVRPENFHPSVIAQMEKAVRDGKADLEFKKNYLRTLKHEELADKYLETNNVLARLRAILKETINKKQYSILNDQLVEAVQASTLIKAELKHRETVKRAAHYQHRRELIAWLDNASKNEIALRFSTANETDKPLIESYIKTHFENGE